MISAPAAEVRGRLHVGLLLIAVGAALTLVQSGLLPVAGLGRFWPILLIGVGLVKVRQPPEDGQRAFGGTLVLVGSLLLFIAIMSWQGAWPLTFVVVGVLLLSQAVVAPSPRQAAPPESPYLSELVFLGGMKKLPRISGFRGGYVTAVLGGVELDLRKVKMGPGPAVLDVMTMWGGIDLKVPASWSVSSQVVPVLGGFEDKSRLLVESTEAPRLVVRGYAIMGGVVIGN